MKPLKELFEDTVGITQDREDMDAMALTVKLMEEVGEFGQEILLENGYMPHKNIDEGSVCEGADVIIVVLSVLAQQFPTSHPRDIIEAVTKSMEQKLDKYKRIVGER